MSELPYYKRKWFLRGVVTVALGLFVMLLSIFQVKSYENRYPELAQSGADRILEQMKQAPEESPDREKTPEEDEAEMERWRVTMLHGKYSRYIYIGAFLMVLGVGLMALGFKEPTVPVLPEEDEEETADRPDEAKANALATDEASKPSATDPS